MPMKKNARIFNCCRCRKLVALCSHCDRGNTYCSKTCATASRKESLQRSGKKYQQSRKGRLKHAERQNRYRIRQRQKVTQHGSPAMSLSGLLRQASKLRTSSLSNTSPLSSEELFCVDCGEACSPFLRLTSLGGRSPPGKSRTISVNTVKRSKPIGHNPPTVGALGETKKPKSCATTTLKNGEWAPLLVNWVFITPP